MKTKIRTSAVFLVLALALAWTLISISLVSALTINSVNVNPQEIGPGETATIDIEIENNLNQDVTDVSVLLDLSGIVASQVPGVASTVLDVPFAPYDSSNEKAIDELEDNEDKNFNFKIIASPDAKAGLYKIPLEVSYTDEQGTVHNKESLISLTVNSKPEIAIELEDGLLLKGQNNKITLRIINRGLSDAKFLEIKVGSSTQYSLLSNDKVYIGDIDSNDFDSASFQLFFKENALSRVGMPVSVSYSDITNKEYTDEFNVEMKVYSRETALQLGLMQKSRTSLYIGIVVALLVLWLLWRGIKRRRKRKKAEAENRKR